MLGFNTSTEYESKISPEQKKFDNKFILFIAVVVAIAVGLIVADMNYLHVGYLVPIGFAVGGAAIVANLIKGYFDWKRKKAMEAEGVIAKRKESTDVEANAKKVASMKPVKRARVSDDEPAKKYTNDALAGVEEKKDEELDGLEFSITVSSFTDTPADLREEATLEPLGGDNK